jgi:SAM-dependent methyltransferase
MREADKEKGDAFAGRMVGLLNNAMLGLMTSIGHRTGLFDKMAELAPSTSNEIAEAAGLDERYVREWLGAMVTGRIVDYDGAKKAYRLPPEHAACLTRAAGPENLAMLTQYIALLGSVEERIAACFKTGGGVSYAAYGDFQKLMSEESSQVHDAMLVDGIVPLVSGLTERLQAGIDVLDVGCGSGHAVNLLAQAFPKSRFTGYDLSDEGVAAGSAESASLGLANTSFAVKDVAGPDEATKYDVVTAFDSIHDQADPAGVLRGIYESIRPGGAFLCVDIAASSNLGDNVDHPLGPMLYTFSTMHCMTVSLALDGAGLGAMWGEERACEMLAEAGFAEVSVRRIDGDIQNNYYIARKT